MGHFDARPRAGAERSKPMAYEPVIKNGWVVDGSGLPRYRADVGAREGKHTGALPGRLLRGPLAARS
jgi:hypothetical protein